MSIQTSTLQASQCAELPAVAGAASAHLTSMAASGEGDALLCSSVILLCLNPRDSWGSFL